MIHQPLIQSTGKNPYELPPESQSNNFSNYQGKNIPVQRDIRASYQAQDSVPDANPLVEKKQSYHIRQLVAWLIFWAVSLTIVFLWTLNPYYKNGYQIYFSVGLAATYLFYLILSMCCNHLYEYLTNIKTGDKLNTEYNNVKNIVGNFAFYIECYHYETRHHTRTVTDSQGRTTTQHYTTTQKVVTHTAREQIIPQKTYDESGTVDRVKAVTDIIFVHFKVNYRFVDEKSRNVFHYKWVEFQNKNRFDVHQDASYKYVLPGLLERMAFYVGHMDTNFKARMLASAFFGLIWPYSMYIESIISRFDIFFTKVLTM